MWNYSDELLQQALKDDIQCIPPPCTGMMFIEKKVAQYNTWLIGQDRYRELMRVARMWRQLKAYKWQGFGHRSDSPQDGALALFCPACPQPGINIPLHPESSVDE
jgi:hypothetical protein